jgi:hypothetical protein
VLNKVRKRIKVTRWLLDVNDLALPGQANDASHESLGQCQRAFQANGFRYWTKPERSPMLS